MSDYPYEAIVVLGDKDEIVEYTGDEVVRCKNCKHKEREQPGMVYCPMMVGSWVADDHFCKWGERGE